MKINNKTHITMSDEDVKNAIIKYLYSNQGISGIFEIKFKKDCNYEFDGAEVTVDLNEK